MANWYYYNKSGEKVGPISVTALKELTRQGLITRETKLENRSGRVALAGQVNGLEFPTQPVSVTLPPPVPQVSANWHYYDARGQKVGPIPFNVLQSLAANGVITPETSVETEDNVTTVAETIEGLTFAAVSPPIAPAAPPVAEEEVYGFASPPPMVDADPFATIPATAGNPFAAPMTATDDPFAAYVPTSQTSPRLSHVPIAGKATKLPKPIIIAGIGGAAIFLLLICGVWVTMGLTKKTPDVAADEIGAANEMAQAAPANKFQFTAEEQAEIDNFIEEYGSDIGWSAMNTAVKRGTVAVVKYLVSQGASVHSTSVFNEDKDYDSISPLHEAVKRQNAEGREILQFLISQGVAVNVKKSGETFYPLGDAIREASNYKDSEELGTIALLVSHGADVNYRGSGGDTPLHAAASKGNLAIVQFLVSKGANVRARNRSDMTPLDRASDRAVKEYLSGLQ